MIKYLDYDGLKRVWGAVKTHVTNSIKNVGDGLRYDNTNNLVYLKESDSNEIGGVKTFNNAFKYYQNNEGEYICDELHLTVYKSRENSLFIPVSAFETDPGEYETINGHLVVSIPVTELSEDSPINVSDEVLTTKNYVDREIRKAKSVMHLIEVNDSLDVTQTEVSDNLLNKIYLKKGYKLEMWENSKNFLKIDYAGISRYDNNVYDEYYLVFSTDNSEGATMIFNDIDTHILTSPIKLNPEDTITFECLTDTESITKGPFYYIISNEISHLEECEGNGKQILSINTTQYDDNENDIQTTNTITYKNDSVSSEYILLGISGNLSNNVLNFKITINSETDSNNYNEYIFIEDSENTAESGKHSGHWEKIGSSEDRFQLATISSEEINKITSDINVEELEG